MSRGANIWVAAAAGAVLAALIANYLNSERGRRFLASASDSLKDLSLKATDFAKNNLSEIIREATSSIGPVAKEKLVQQLSKSSQTSQPASQH